MDEFENRLARAGTLARLLQKMLRLYRVEALDYNEPYQVADSELWLEHIDRTPIIKDIGDVVKSLDEMMADSEFELQISEFKLQPGEFWSLGSSVITLPVRSIFRGFVEPARLIPIVPPLSERLVAFLITIPGEEEFLKREQHNQIGWHYHYCSADEERSDAVLCWDARASYDLKKQHPLFQEFHGAGRFRSRPDLWGDRKKKSMHDACAPDLKKWPLNSFRCASNDSKPVWPLSAVLTPRPATWASSQTPPAKKSARNRR